MFRSSLLWFWRKTIDCFATVGILAFLVSASLSDKSPQEIPKKSLKALIWKAFDSNMVIFLKVSSDFIFTVVFSTMYFGRILLGKFRHCFQWWRNIFVSSSMMSILYYEAANIYVLFWFKIIELVESKVENLKTQVIIGIGNSILPMSAYISTVIQTQQEYLSYYILSPFEMLVVAFNLICACLKLMISLINLSLLNSVEFCLFEIFDIIHMPPQPQTTKST